MARSINVNEKGLASGVTYVDKTTGETREIKARTVVAACGALETTRLMLLSTSPLFPNGIANSSGMLGQNFIEHLDTSAQGYLTDLSFVTPYAGDGIGGSHIVIPWFGYDRPQKTSTSCAAFKLNLRAA